MVPSPHFIFLLLFSCKKILAPSGINSPTPLPLPLSPALFCKRSETELVGSLSLSANTEKVSFTGESLHAQACWYVLCFISVVLRKKIGAYLETAQQKSKSILVLCKPRLGFSYQVTKCNATINCTNICTGTSSPHNFHLFYSI